MRQKYVEFIGGRASRELCQGLDPRTTEGRHSAPFHIVVDLNESGC